MSESWYVLRSDAATAAENMAVDEALLETVRESNRAVLRFYSWSEAAATFGYSQRFEEVSKMTPLRPLVRRPTGGGLVSHDGDWTYSLIFPPTHRWARLRAVESYRGVHEWLRTAFGGTGVETELESRVPGLKRGDCFARAERHDLLWHGAKIAGAAQRRNRLGLLIQGSVRPPTQDGRTVRDRETWEAAMLFAGAGLFEAEWVTLHLGARLIERVQSLRVHKYSCEAYNCSR